MLYRTINYEADAITLQKYQWTMEQWEAKWLKESDLDQCEIVTVAHTMSYVNYPYNTHTKELAHVPNATYLGLTFSNNF